MSTKTGRLICVLAGILGFVAGILILFQATDVWPLVIGIPCILGGVLGIMAGMLLSRNERASGALLVAAAVASFVCLNLVSAIVFIVVRVYVLQTSSYVKA